MTIPKEQGQSAWCINSPASEITWSLLPYSTGQGSHKDLPRVKGKGQKPSPAPQWEESQGDIGRAGRMEDTVVVILAKQNLSYV